MIRWLNEKEKEGYAMLYPTNLTLNSRAAIPFENAYRVMVGIEDNGDLILCPLGKDVVDRGIYDPASLYAIASRKSYARISSTSLMTMLAEELGLDLSSEPVKLKARWDGENHYLIIKRKEA